jgi:membrane protease subunit HflC
LLFFPLIIAAVIALSSSVHVVDETEQAIVLQFGRPVGVPITEPGLYFKTPLIQEVRKFDKRIISWDGYPNEVPTKGREFVFVDATARWRITNAQLFLESVRDERGAQSRLNDIIDSAVRDEVSSLPLAEIVRSKDWSPRSEDIESNSMFAGGDDEALDMKITTGREGLTRKILERASRDTPSIGIELVDLRFKRLNYVASVREKVYERMISERKRNAAQFRSEGEGRSAEIRGRTEKELQEIRSSAAREAEIVRGKADADAARIYAEAFNAAPDFYSFLRTLESYSTTITGSTTLVLGTNGDYFKFLQNVGQAGDVLSSLDVEARIRRINETAPTKSSVADMVTSERVIGEDDDTAETLTLEDDTPTPTPTPAPTATPDGE